MKPKKKSKGALRQWKSLMQSMLKKKKNNCKVACITGPKYNSIPQQYILKIFFAVVKSLMGVAHLEGKILKSDLKYICYPNVF
jgi:hypothetical protein